MLGYFGLSAGRRVWLCAVHCAMLFTGSVSRGIEVANSGCARGAMFVGAVEGGGALHSRRAAAPG
eukprot:6190141-Pleurochrysis_carterae.AAC.1